MKKSTTASNILWFLGGLILMGVLQHCSSDDPFVNLRSELTVEQSSFQAVEGSSFEIDLRLSEPLSEDLILELEVETDFTSKYANPEDYHTHVEWSLDNGEDWNRSSLDNIRFPALQKHLKVRFFSVDDDRLEIQEELNILIHPLERDLFEISGDRNPVHIVLEDNEPNAFESGYDFETTVIFDVDSDFRFHLVGLDPVMEIDSKIKSIIDEGLESPMYDDLRSLFALTDLSIVRFEALYTLNPENALGGYVYNRSTDTDAWVLGLNLFYAYHRVTAHGSEPMHYNQDGTYGYILAHEFGHLLTLNFAHEVDPYSTHENCSELLLQEGCFKQQSILNSFNNTFYINNESPLKDPTHVTPYAQTNIAEDIDETFAYYIHQDPIPELNPTSSGALHKIHFSGEQSLFMQLKPQMRHHLDIRQLPHIANPIYSKTLRPFGKLNSCLEVKRKRN